MTVMRGCRPFAVHVGSSIDQGESRYENVPGCRFAAGDGRPRHAINVGKGASLGRFARLSQRRCCVDKYDTPASGFHIHASNGEDEATNYFFDTYGPYPIVGAAIAAGINQFDNTPPEWKQGAQGYGKRFGSDFGIAAVTTTTRYALSKTLHEDTLYYRCQCKGFFPRLNHAMISTFTSRRGEH